MKKLEKKKFVFKKILEKLTSQNFYLVKTGLDPTFILKEKDRVISFFLNFKDAGQIDFSKIQITINEVEDVMFEIKKPNQDYSFLDNTKYFLITIEDKITAMPAEYFHGIGYDVETEEQLLVFTDWIINYLENEAQFFIKKYSYLPNILTEMDRLQNEGLNWNHKDRGILSGSLDAYFRGLIISKLCNDVNFENKIKKMDLKFNEVGYESWLPYYEKLKTKLETLNPIFNI